MKIFVEPEGKFAIKVPIEWGYKNLTFDARKEEPHSFELYENSAGYFQINCYDRDKGSLPQMIAANNLTEQKTDEKISFTKRVILSESFDMHIWMALVGNDFFLIKYIYDSKKRDSKKIKKELEKVSKILPTVIYLEPEHRKGFLERDRFDKFMSAIAAVIDLRNRAVKNESYIELVILIANHIDALLRLSLILNQQLKNKSGEINTSLLFQGESDKPIIEKKIYKMALEEDIITKEIYEKLFNLYNDRNKVVHRYIITDLQTRNVMQIAIDYSRLQEKIGLIVEKFEQEQFKQKIGIYGTDNPPDKLPDKLGIKRIISNIKDKHGDREFNKNMTIGK